MGLQYFEALSPGTIASIVAVLTNRLVVGNDVTGYFRYPFLTATLPSSIFWCAVIYGFYGCLIGTWYTHGTKKLKMFVHDWFHVPHDDDDHGGHDVSTSELASHLDVDDQAVDEKLPLMSNGNGKVHAKQEIGALGRMKKYLCLVIPDEPKRASVAGTLAGALVGVIGMFVPHIMFWGEAQLQNLIDKGRTPLPIFGEEGNDAMTALAVCMIDPNDAAAIHAGFGIGCSLLISVTKTIVIGLSLGTGIVGGHFWGPLYVGCAASHLLTDLVKLFDARFGFGGGLGTHPCVVILCVMGAAHVGKWITIRFLHCLSSSNILFHQ
jgi:H+/Cl- antiporter ClcA